METVSFIAGVDARSSLDASPPANLFSLSLFLYVGASERVANFAICEIRGNPFM